ncbi:MAG: NAD-dependent epimerase/dehydratase family protein [Opitutales bacterium]
MSNILITGGAGLIGSRVTEFLLKENHSITIIDPFIRYLPTEKLWFSDYLERRFSSLDAISFIRGDTVNLGLVQRTIDEFQPEYVLHLAGMPLANQSNIYIEEAIQGIVDGTVNLLQSLIGSNHLRNFVYVSSSMVYGDFQEFPCPETHQKNPKDVYGASKYCGEIMTRAFSRRFEVPCSIVRPSAVYGPFDINRRVIQIFIENALDHKPITLDGGGDLRFDFTYVDDIANGLIAVLLQEAAIGEDFNITYGKGYSLKEVSEELLNHFPDLEVVINEERDQNRPLRGALDVSKAKEILNFKPKFNLREGIRKYIQSYEDLSAEK